ncbi:MAG: hypothetical protein OXG62_03135 [Nitrospinae bacterium]|nr:hypothetical protein [Nitrospinota bacterium]
MNEELFDNLVDALPERFVRELIDKQGPVYKEAYEMGANNPAFGKPEAQFILPYNRHCLFQALFRNAALDSGLQASVLKNKTKNFEYNLVRAGRFLIISHYMPSPYRRQRFRHYSSQLAEINHLLLQGVLALEGFECDLEMYERGDIACFLIHGPDTINVQMPGFMDFAFPSPNTNKGWVRIYTASEVQAAIQTKGIKEVGHVDVPRPEWKKKSQENKG